MPENRIDELQPTTPGPEGTTSTTTVVLPESPNGRAVVLFQEIFGVGEFVLGKAADLAGLGYTVSCPDVFWRVGHRVALSHDPEQLGRAFELAQRWGGEVPDEVTAEDLATVVAHARTLVDGKVAAMGYCLGGTLAYRTAGTTDVDACVSYYGSGVAELLAAGVVPRCPTIFHFGGKDEYLPQEQVDAVRSGLADRDDVEVHVQPGAGHAFENLVSHFADPDAAAASWPLTVDFLAARLG